MTSTEWIRSKTETRDRLPAQTLGQMAAAISAGLVRFERAHIGRGPGDIQTQLMDDMVIVRMTDALTAQEKTLARAGSGELLKQMRARVLESGRPELDELLREVTGRGITRLFGDLCPESEERVLVFILAGTPDGTVH